MRRSAESPLPFEINKKELKTGLETLLDHRVLSLRHPQVHAVFTIQSTDLLMNGLEVTTGGQAHPPSSHADGLDTEPGT